MLSEDVKPSRLQKAALIAKHFARKAAGHQMSIIDVNASGDATLVPFGGNVGIGTYSAAYKVDVSQPLAAGTARFLNTNSAWATDVAIDYAPSGGTLAGSIGLSSRLNGDIWIRSGNSSGSMIFQTAGQNERMRIDNTGQVGIGASPTAGRVLTITKNITGGTGNASYGIVLNSTVQSDANTYAYGMQTALSTQATSYTQSQLYYYTAAQGTFGAGSTVSNQYAFVTGANMIGATNNYGFYNNIPVGSGRWGFYSPIGTANNFFGATTLVASNSLTDTSSVLQIAGPTVLSTFLNNQYSYTFKFVKSRATTPGSYSLISSGDQIGYFIFKGDDGTAYQDAAYIHCYAEGTPAAGSMPGRLSFSTSAPGSVSPTVRMTIDSSGQVGIGATPAAGYSFAIAKNITGGASNTSYGMSITGFIQTDSNTQAALYSTIAQTAANSAPYTLNEIRHYNAYQGTLGANTTVTSQSGFIATSTLTGATYNYGFYGNIPVGAGDWNFYAAGTANNILLDKFNTV